jgi:hypothetical protein
MVLSRSCLQTAKRSFTFASYRAGEDGEGGAVSKPLSGRSLLQGGGMALMEKLEDLSPNR